MSKGFKDYLAEANAVIDTCSVQEAMELHRAGTHVFVDVRDGDEVAAGKIPGAVHASRGLLEFRIDPASPLHDAALAQGKPFVFYCGTGGRSALAAHRAGEMGLERVVNMAGGFTAWKAADGPVE